MSSMSADFFDGHNPVALIVSKSDFLAENLAEKLLTRGVKVLLFAQNDDDRFFSNLKNRENFIFLEHNLKNLDSKIIRLNYVFCLDVLNETLKYFTQVTERLNARILVGFNFDFEDNKVKLADLLSTINLNYRIVYWLDVVGPKMDTLSISQNQEASVYPLFIDDLTEGLIKALLSSGTNKEMLIFGGEKITQYSLTQEIERINPGLSKLFSKNKKEDRDENIIASEVGLISWQPKISINRSLSITSDWLIENPNWSEKNKNIQKPTPQKQNKFWENNDIQNFKVKTNSGTVSDFKKIESKKAHKQNITLIFIAFLFLIFVILLPLFQFIVGAGEMFYAKWQLASNPKEAVGWFNNSSYWFEYSANNSLVWGTLPFTKEVSKKISRKAKQLSYYSKIISQTANVSLKVGELNNLIFGNEGYPQSSKIEALKTEIASLERELGFLEAELGTDITISLFSNKYSLLEKESVSALRKKIGFTSSMLTVLPEITGIDGKKVYAILLTDNTTLSPGGGIVDSIAFITFEKGRMINLEIVSAETADSLLKGQIDPPVALSKYSRVKSWNLINSLWSADFPTGASRASWFIEKEYEKSVDGVIVYNLETVKAFLQYQKFLELEDGVKINTNNLYQNMITDKRLLTKINRAIAGKLTSSKIEIADLNAFYLSAKENNLVLWIKNSKIQELMSRYNWDGGVDLVNCSLALTFENCKTDYLQITDANFSEKSKSNLVNKSASLDIDIKDDVLSHRLNFLIGNQNQDVYKSYLQIYTPATSQESLMVVVNPSTGEQVQIVPEITQEKGKKVYGLFVEIPTGETRQIVFLWDVRAKSTENEGELVFLWQKQKGERLLNTSLRINLPESGLKVGAFPAPSLTGQGVIEYNVNLLEDFLTNIVWQPK